MSDKPWGHFERLRPAQIDAVKAECPVAYLPWGALEWHSYHNPIGLDCIKALGLCEALAQHTGGLVLPPVYVGTDTIKPFKGFGHTLEHPVSTVEKLMLEFMEQLADEGFKVIVVLTGHYGGGHVDVLKSAAESFGKTHPGVGLYAFTDGEALDGDYPMNHAALGETSFQLLFAPECVDLSLLPEGREATLDQDGVWGDDPRKATADKGREMLAVFLRNVVPEIEKLIEEHIT